MTWDCLYKILKKKIVKKPHYDTKIYGWFKFLKIVLVLRHTENNLYPKVQDTKLLENKIQYISNEVQAHFIENMQDVG
jgi:hypothetical protein